MRVKDLPRNLRKGETLFPLFLFVVVGVLFYDSLQAPPRPMLLPRAVQFVLLVLLAFQTGRSLLAPSREVQATPEQHAAGRKESRKMLVTFIGMLLIPVAVHLVGFLLTGAVYVVLTIVFWGGRRIRDIVIAEAILLALLYGVFQRLLSIPLPAGILFGG